MNRTTKGALIALSVAAMFSAKSALAESHDADAAKGDAKVKCVGVNECKGKGECGGAGNECAGKNECKGKGVLSMTEEECKEKGGKVAS